MCEYLVLHGMELTGRVLQIKSKILPFSELIIELLGNLWKQTQEHALLKCSVLQCLSALLQVRLIRCTSSVRANATRRCVWCADDGGKQSVGAAGIPQIGNTCLQVIGISTDPSADRDLFYVTDGLQLWISLLMIIEEVCCVHACTYARRALPVL
jgi:hypothetical protein